MNRLATILSVLAIVSGAIAAGTIWGCASAVPEIQDADPAALRFSAGANEAVSLSWSPQEERLVRDWIAGLETGGAVSFVTYAPGSLTVSAPDFTANFLEDGTLVVNAKTASGSGWKQIVRQRTAVDSSFFDLATEKLVRRLVPIPTVPFSATPDPVDEIHAESAETEPHMESAGDLSVH